MFRLERRQKDGATLREHLESVAEQTGKVPDQLLIPALPAAAEHTWLAFLEIAGRRQVGGFGPGPLTYPDLLAWAQLTGRTVTPMEVRWLCRLDDCWLNSQQDQ